MSKLLLLLLGVLLASVPASQTGPAARPPQPPKSSLTQLLSAPARHLGKELRVTLQFKALSEDWEPFLSRFQPPHWLALEVWPDEVFTWDHTVFSNPVKRIFLRRGGGFEPLARRARTYQRFEARVRVREVFLGEPWLELLDLVPLEGEVGEGTILHVTRARDFLHGRQFQLALDQYQRARAAPLPPHALAALLEEIRKAEAERAHVQELGEIRRVSTKRN